MNPSPAPASAAYPDGYPVLFDTHLSLERATQLLTYVSDGGLLQPDLTESMTLQVGACGRYTHMRQYVHPGRYTHMWQCPKSRGS